MINDEFCANDTDIDVGNAFNCCCICIGADCDCVGVDVCDCVCVFVFCMYIPPRLHARRRVLSPAHVQAARKADAAAASALEREGCACP